MPNQDDIIRLQKGKDAWNEWAENNQGADVNFREHQFINADFQGFVFPGFADFSHVRFKGKAEFKDAKFFGEVDFQNAKFLGSTGFVGCEFRENVYFSDADCQDVVWFTKAVFAKSCYFQRINMRRVCFFLDARFLGNADFLDAEIGGSATFTKARFGSTAVFDDIKFHSDATFDYARFAGNAEFINSRFVGVAYFRHARFDTVAHFEDATFVDDAWFYDARFGDIADFSKATFDSSAIFELANFQGNATFYSADVDGPFSLASARFDQVPNLIQTRFRAPARLDNLEIIQAHAFSRNGDKDKAARYRALKKMSIESHDHVRELDFFASEAIERRGNDDPKCSARFWFGFAYEFVSDFGRDILRPIYLLFILWGLFSLVYVAQRDASSWLNCGPHGLLPVGKAAYLSFVNSLPFIGLGKSDQIKQISHCLFDSDALPLWITVLTTFQTLLSTVLVFLFLLALRNHFKIK